MSEAPSEKSSIEIFNQVETVARLYSLINDAERHIFLVSPYVSIDKLRTLGRHLQGALARKVKVKLVIREKDASTGGQDVLTSEAVRTLRDAGMEVRVLKDLHAKIYLSDKNALITSLNLLESSFNNSIEVGAWLAANTPEYQKVVSFLRTEIQPTSVLVAALPKPAVLAEAPQAESTNPSRKKRTATKTPPKDDQDALFADEDPEDGTCIRCGDGIDFDTEKPLCGDCYSTWKRYGDPSYEEEYCHACGEESGTSMAKPLCYNCYKSGDHIPF